MNYCVIFDYRAIAHHSQLDGLKRMTLLDARNLVARSSPRRGRIIDVLSLEEI